MSAVPVLDRDVALDTLRDLMQQGFAGVDAYDDGRFVVDAPQPFLEAAERAIDALGGYFIRTVPPGRTGHVEALMPSRARLELGLDCEDVPTLATPLRHDERPLDRILNDMARTPL